MNCIFVTDLHGKTSRYKSLFKYIISEKPEAVFIGGDILPLPYEQIRGGPVAPHPFLNDYIISHFKELKTKLGNSYPGVYIILGNDDLKINEQLMIEAEKHGTWHYINNKKAGINDFNVYGYCFVPPTPFRLKDWEKYDVSRFTDPGCNSPAEGFRSVEANPDDIEYSTIQKDLESLAGNDDLAKSVFLFHSPPYQTNLDRAGIDGQMVDHIPLDVHVGSIAIKRFIEEREPLLTLHGHIHESTRITGNWKDRIGDTICFNGANDGPELAIISFNLDNLQNAERMVI